MDYVELPKQAEKSILNAITGEVIHEQQEGRKFNLLIDKKVTPDKLPFDTTAWSQENTERIPTFN